MPSLVSLARLKTRRGRWNRGLVMCGTPIMVSLPSSLDHLEFIDDLGFKDEHILAQSVLYPMFVDDQPLLIVATL